ncbi:hypothetical protein ACROSR_13715 [Roseovarius tibetensis]|uniref:hypothetical protein n=1 Tax=Roseovarius tibetensis TaxID=2685897 RepID=UPI003D7F1EA7
MRQCVFLSSLSRYNRLITAQLEKNWEIALRRVQDLEARQPADTASTIEVDPSAFANMAENLSAAWILLM